jgi:hypothetical protein
MQFAVTAAALIVAAAAVYFTVTTARGERNAALVSIGIQVLRADPGRESQVTAAREWALDLIDANAGGVKFSQRAREELLQRALHFGNGGGGGDGGGCYGPDGTPIPPKSGPPNSK